MRNRQAQAAMAGALTATAALACDLAAAGIQIVRVHAVGPARAALALSATIAS